MKLKPQFSLRFLLLAIAACALMLMAWRNRPPRDFRVQLTTRGTAIIHDEEVALSSLTGMLDREVSVRKMWLVQPRLILAADTGASLEDVVSIIQLGRKAGVEQFTFASPANPDRTTP